MLKCHVYFYIRKKKSTTPSPATIFGLFACCHSADTVKVEVGVWPLKGHTYTFCLGGNGRGVLQPARIYEGLYQAELSIQNPKVGFGRQNLVGKNCVWDQKSRFNES